MRMVSKEGLQFGGKKLFDGLSYISHKIFNGGLTETIASKLFSLMEKPIEKKEKNINQSSGLSIFNKLPGFEEKTGDQQMDVFVNLLKSNNLLSVKESEDFYDISISLPYGDYKLHCTKEDFCLNYDYKLHCDHELPEGYYTEITNLDENLINRGFYRIMEEDVEKLSKDLLFLFDKLGENNISLESYYYYGFLLNIYRMKDICIDDYGEVWSFFGMFISNVLKEFTKSESTHVWLGNSNNIDGHKYYPCAGSFLTNCHGRLDHDVRIGRKERGNYESCRALYIEK